MKKIIFVLAVTLGFHSYSRALFLVEPYIGYQVMVVSLTTGSSNAGIPLKLDGTGLGAGFRLGLSASLLFVAVDYGMASLTTKLKEGLVTVTPGTSLHTSLGGTAGLNLGPIRPYAGAILSDELIGSGSGFTGTGYKAGIGVGGIPKFKVNFEYYSVTYTKYENTATVTLPDANTYESASMTGVMLNGSFPF